MKIKNLKWLLVLIMAFSLVGVAYSAWEQRINVNNEIETAFFNGQVYLAGNDETITVREVDFSNTYDLEVSRSKENTGLMDIEVSDQLILNNTASIPVKFYMTTRDWKITSEIKIDYVIEQAAIDENDENIFISQSETIRIPSENWLFSIEEKGLEENNLSYEEFIIKMNDLLSQKLDIGENRTIQIKEKLTGNIEDYLKDVDGNGNSVNDYKYEVIWTYKYEVKQVPFNR